MVVYYRFMMVQQFQNMFEIVKVQKKINLELAWQKVFCAIILNMLFLLYNLKLIGVYLHFEGDVKLLISCFVMILWRLTI